jgi:hypothetical protein
MPYGMRSPRASRVSVKACGEHPQPAAPRRAEPVVDLAGLAERAAQAAPGAEQAEDEEGTPGDGR